MSKLSNKSKATQDMIDDDTKYPFQVKIKGKNGIKQHTPQLNELFFNLIMRSHMIPN